jgi:hypothetical protein
MYEGDFVTGTSHFAEGVDMVLYTSMGTFYIICHPHVNHGLKYIVHGRAWGGRKNI